MRKMQAATTIIKQKLIQYPNKMEMIQNYQRVLKYSVIQSISVCYPEKNKGKNQEIVKNSYKYLIYSSFWIG